MKKLRRTILITFFLTIILICFSILLLQRLDELSTQDVIVAKDHSNDQSWSVHDQLIEVYNNNDMCSKFYDNSSYYPFQLESKLFTKVLTDVDVWKLAESWTSHRHVFIENSTLIGTALQAMVSSKIIKADVGFRGTQLKLLLTLQGDQKVSFKPKWYSRDYIVTGAPYSGADRHNGEIAAFHLTRILGFQRTPLTVGRNVDLDREILPVATEALAKTFFKKDGNTCFYGKCYYCRGEKDGVCAEGTALEGVLSLWMAPSWTLKTWKHPWRRSYNSRIMPWEQNDEYCKEIIAVEPFQQGPRLLDIIDTVVLDYLIGNADRHRYETFDGFADSIMLIMDNAKSFGNPYHDEKTILAPLYQCCRIRLSLWKRLQKLRFGVISSLLQCSLKNDPLYPVLHHSHYQAVDRRLEHIINTVTLCIDKLSANQVLLNDGYS